jgi:DNA-binding NtrC family response regulator
MAAEPLVADRFIVRPGGSILDLATGDRVLLECGQVGDREEQAAWAERCAARLGLGDAKTPELVDYGVLSSATRFEAYRIPTGSTVPLCPGSTAPVDPLPGLQTPPAPLVASVIDLLDNGRTGEPRAVWAHAAGGAGRRLLLGAIAREARLRGFVPISTACAGWLLADDGAESTGARLLTGRHLLVIHDEEVNTRTNPAAALARIAVLAGTGSPRPHVFLVLRAMAGTITPVFAPASSARAKRRMSADDHPFLVCESHAVYGAAGAPVPATSCGPAVFPDVDPVRVSWDTGHEGDWHRRVGTAARLAQRGRHAAAERMLRDALGGLTRRDNRAGAAAAALALGCLLLDRGRAEEAVRASAAARDDFNRAGDGAGAIDAAILMGLAWVDEGRLREAEAALRAASIAAVQLDDVERLRRASLALARTLYWQGRFADAERALGDIERGDVEQPVARPGHDDLADAVMVAETAPSLSEEHVPGQWACDARTSPPGTRGGPEWPDIDRGVAVASLRVRVAVAAGDFQAAGCQATRALDRAARIGQPLERCVAHAAAAALYAAIADAGNLAVQVRCGFAAARHAHAPLRALRLRLILAKGLETCGDLPGARRVRRRLARIRLERLPALLRAAVQVTLSTDETCRGGATAARAAVRAFVSTSGAVALEPRAADAPPAIRLAFLDDILSLVRICHVVEDERTTLERVSKAIRDRLRAAAVAFFGADGDVRPLLASAGTCADLEEVARRATDTGMLIGPARTAGGTECAAPVHYAGEPVGALACRWTADIRVDESADALLSAAAAAAAPCVRAVLDRRMAPVPARPGAEPELLGASAVIVDLRRAVARAARVPFPVLVQGESGSGKELVARAIHRESPRRHRRFCAFNCAALAEDLIEAELFGYARGAFTGAVAERIGLFEDADGGTLFLDEVGDLSGRAQAKLLRVIQEGEVRRVGENAARSIDVRIVAASNRSLVSEARAGRFRSDLLYRLDVVRLDVPALRQRVDDIPLLAAHFWDAAIARTGSRATLAPSTIAALARYDWPGNVRELQNVIATLAVGAPRRGSVGPASLPSAFGLAISGGTAAATLEDARRLFEIRFVRAALARAGGHRAEAARALGLSRQGLAKLITRLGLDVDQDAGDRA